MKRLIASVLGLTELDIKSYTWLEATEDRADGFYQVKTEQDVFPKYVELYEIIEQLVKRLPEE